jgi:WD40 repeat protein
MKRPLRQVLKTAGSGQTKNMPFCYNENLGDYIIATLFDSADEPVVAVASGFVVFPDTETNFEAHPKASILSAAIHPSGVGIVTGGDDGRLVWTTKDTGPVELSHHTGAWLDGLAVNNMAMLIAASAGKTVFLHDLVNTKHHVFEHPHSVTDLIFDSKGQRLYTSSYNGAYIWFSRISPQKPQVLKWKGSHTKISISPDDKFLITAMQDNDLHGWRLTDAKDMRMGGYPVKIKSLTFFANGKLMATSGANGAVVWPFLKTNGPMGEEASEINAVEDSMVSVVSGAAEDTLLAAGLEDGRVWLAELQTEGIDWIKPEKGATITALSLSNEANRIIFGDEDGNVYIFEAEA